MISGVLALFASGLITRTVDENGLRDFLTDITARHVHADVPLGALLSGGLDSSVLAALGQHATRGALRTFSVDFAGHQ